MKNKIKFTLQDYMSLPLYLAFRRLLPKSNSPGVVLLPRLAFFSIVLGVSASILILSLANGLHHNYLQRLAESDSHLSIISIGKGIPAYQEIIQNVKSHPEVTSAYPYSQDEALLKTYGETTGIVLKGYPQEFVKDRTFNTYFRLLKGEWSFDNPRTITIGEALSKGMAIFIGDTVEILTFDEVLGTITYRFKVSGIFTANDGLLDKGLAFISFDDASEIFDFDGYSPYIGIRIKNYQDSEKVSRSLAQNYNIPFNIKTWKITHLNTLLALDNEKQIIRVLLVIFFCVAFFGILAVMTALVTDKRDEIALLKTLGMTPKENFKSFVFTGLLLGFTASIVGVVFGILLSWNFNNIISGIEYLVNLGVSFFGSITNQKLNTFHFLNQNVYYLKEFPIRIQVIDIFFSAFSAICCTLLAAIYPASISKNFKPAEILRKRAF